MTFCIPNLGALRDQERPQLLNFLEEKMKNGVSNKYDTQGGIIYCIVFFKVPPARPHPPRHTWRISHLMTLKHLKTISSPSHHLLGVTLCWWLAGPILS